MAIDYRARPTDAKNFTTSSEVNLTQDFQDYSEFLPAINRTESLQNFFGATVNQLLSSGSTQSIDAYWGRLSGRNYNPENELFQPENSATRLNYQFQPGVVSRLAGKPQQTTSYVNWLNRLESLGADVNNHDRLFSEQGYVLDLPINADMFTNHHNYYWLEGDIPLIEIELGGPDTFDIDKIPAKSQHTTAILSNHRTVEFVTGLRVKFIGTNIISTSGNYPVDSIYYVENVGGKGGIKLIEIENAAGDILFPTITPYYIEHTTDWNLATHDPTVPDDNYSLNKTYTVMERWASDKNPWARTNHWFSIHAIQIAVEFNNLSLEVYANKFNRSSRPIIEFNANMELTQTCKNYVENVDYVVSSAQMTAMTGESEYYIDDDYTLEDGDIVLAVTLAADNVGPFSTSFGGAYGTAYTPSESAFDSNYNDAYGNRDDSSIYAESYTVSGVGSSIQLTQKTAFNLDDYVLVNKGSEIGYVYCLIAKGWEIGQNKHNNGTAPLFILYDEHNVSLNDFPTTDFAGDTIFSYATSLTGAYDRELGIRPDFTNSGTFGNYNFDWTLNNNRYNQNVTVVSREEIRGLYYFRNWVDDAYYNGWSNIVGGQRVPIIQTQVSDGINNIVFELGTDAISKSTEYTVAMVEGQLRWYTNNYIDRTAIGYDNPELIMKHDTNYTFNDLIFDDASKLEMVDPYGNADANITYGGPDTVKTFSVAAAYEYDTVVYRRADDPSVSGEIFITDANHNSYEVIKNGQRLIDGSDFTFSGTQITLTDILAENDVVELSYVANTDMSNVVYDVAPVHFYNSENTPFSTAGYDDINKHLSSQLSALPGFTGDVNGLNNYHQTLRQHTHGGIIRQQIFETKKIQYLLDQEDINPIRALKSFSRDYADFKQFFKNKVQQLWTTRSWDTVQSLVNQALSDINIGKNATFKYANSDMLYYTQAQSVTHPMPQFASTKFSLPRTRNQYGDTQNHVNVWLTDYDVATDSSVQRPLTVNIDYTIAGQELTLLTTVNVPASLTIKWYDHTQTSNVPFSAVKLGFIAPTQVEVIGGELIGHDSSRHTLTGSDLLNMDSVDFDVVGAALWDFELRIFNNLVDAHFVNETVGQSMATLYPAAARNVGYTVADINTRLDDWYNRWAVRNFVTDIDTVDYDAADEFTWNYSSVGPNLGSWRSLYVFTFGTDRPDTHPWEMLGHNVKPSWWDTHYSWTTGAKRNSLEQAVQYGITGNKFGPSKVDLRYAHPTFDKYTYDIVSGDGNDTLFGPVTAGVVPAPSSLDAAKDFVFGDWSEVENVWRKSSEYPFALAEVLLQLKPYRTHGTFWQLGRWDVRTNVTQEQWIDTETCNRTHISEIHNELIADGIIDHISVVNGGENYDSLDIEFKADKICYRNATAIAYTDGNAVTSVAVTNPGRGFENDPTTVHASSGTGVELEFILDFAHTVTRLGFNTLPAEEYAVNSENTNALSTALTNLEINYMLHVGGYTDKRILQIEVDGNYNSGLIRIPESSYDILIDRNAPTNVLFYSGVKIEKITSGGYRVSGYDLDSKFFNFLRPSNSGKQVAVDIGNTEVTKHFNWHNEIIRVPYNTIISKRQELYQFLLGMGKYYETLGFDVYNRWEVEAYSAIIWSLDSNSIDPHHVNGIDTTLTYKQGTHGVVQTVDVNYDGVSNVLDADFKNIRRTELLVLRNNDSTEYSLKSDTDRICGLGVRVVEFEHIIVLNNTTVFNDPIYQPEIGIGLNRVHLVGERTRNWNGRVEAPGYLVQDSGLVLNLESSVHELETESVTSESKALERLTRQTIGYNVGYTKPTYMSNMFVNDNSAYRFEKGVREYKGTAIAIQAMTRNKNIFGSSFEHEIYEEWMVRLGDFGDVSERNPVQFAVQPDKIKSDPQHFRINNVFTSDKSEDLIIDLHKGSADSISGNYESPFSTYDTLRLDNTSISALEQYQPFMRDAGLPLIDEIDYYLGSVDDVGTVYDPTEEYALIPNWSDTTAYVKGDRIRRYGNVYRLAVDTTGLTDVEADVVIRGTQQYPQVANGQTFIANGTTVLFDKKNTSISYDPIIVNGSAISPTVPSGSTMPLNGVSVNFIKTAQQTTYSDIVLDGNVTNPLITNENGKVFTVYYANTSAASLTSINVPFDELKTTMIMQQIWRDALLAAGATNTANARIVALEELRNDYITGAGNTVSAWETFISDYYDLAPNPDLYVNPEYMGIQVAANLGAAWEIAARALIQIDLDLLTELGATHTETETTIVSGRGSFNNAVTFDADMSTVNTLLDFGNTATDANENLQAFRDYVISNGSTTITTGQSITVPHPTDYVIDDLAAIETKISDALTLASAPATITVSVVGDIITLSRTSNDVGFRLGASTFGELGFLSIDNDVESSGTITTAPADLTLAEAVLAVNNAGIAGVAAQSANNRMRITCNTEQLVIGAGSGTNALGFNLGLINATTNTTTVPVDLAIGDIVTQINAAPITNLIATQVEGALILTYTGTSLVIGDGTANTEIGIIANTYTGFTSENQNTFLVTDWEIVQDPAHFNVWTIDNIGSNPRTLITTTNRYDVLQTLDFRIGVLEICAGDESGDDALIKCDAITTLAVGEYVLIINSTCIPSIDGIHQVTRLMGTAGFFIDQYIEQKGFTGKVLPLRSVRFPNTTVANAAMLDTNYIQDGLGLRSGDYVYVDERLDTNANSLGHGAVYTVQRSVSGAALVHLRDETGKTDNSQIKNGTLYNNITGETVINFEVYDPLKGIIPGVAGREIDIRSDADFAYYNNSTDPVLELREKNAWGASQVGKVWWDLSNAIYLNYDQHTTEYRQTHWGELFPTATIDVYEWTKSPVTPDAYQDAVNSGIIIDGNELTGVAYAIIDQFGEAQYNWCESAEVNINTNQIDIYFYFWVSRKTTTPTIAREYSILQIAAVIGDPTTQQVDWIAATSANTVLVSSLTRSVVHDNLVMQINFDKGDANYHQEFALLAENDPALVIPEWLHISLRDSLAGFTQQTETVNYTQWGSVPSYTPGDVVLSLAGNYFRNHIASTNNDPDADTDNNHWILLEFNENNPDGVYTGNDTVSVNIPRSIPDLNLHPSVRYGVETRPHQTWFVNISNARKAVVEKINSQFIAINLVDSDIPWSEEFERIFTVGSVDYDITQYWNFYDWSIAGYVFDSTVGDYFVEHVSDLAALTPTTDQIAQVERSNDLDGRPRRSAWQYSDGTWSLVYKEKATIQFNSLLWNHTSGQAGWDTIGWDTAEWDRSASAVMVEIFNSFYTSIWTQEYRGLYADIWFYMAKHVLGEQNEVDWIFKTSYFKLIVEDKLEKQYNKYFTEHTDDFFDFVNTIKPFHSKLRDGIVRKLADETYDAIALDTAEIRVQTNPSGSTIDEISTRSFRIHVGTDRSNYASQIVDSNKMLLGSNISPTSTFIPYLKIGDGTIANSGAIWINGERIEFTGKTVFGTAPIVSGFSTGFSDGFNGLEMLTGVTRGTQGTFARSHSFADIIEDETTHELTENTTLNNYGGFTDGVGTNLSPAWNELGNSLLDGSNASPNAIAIRADGFGTIDPYGNIQHAQWFARQETTETIALFQLELQELFDLMAAEWT
jgi:hypothetical protein